MPEGPSKRQILLVRSVIALIIALLIFGLIRYSRTPTALGVLWHELLERPGGPMTFRFILQPAMAAIVATRDGIKDARARRSPYLWAIIANSAERGSRLYEGLISTARIILLGLVMDAIYQIFVLNSFRPVQAVIIALLLAFIPYVLLRGPAARIARWWRGDA